MKMKKILLVIFSVFIVCFAHGLIPAATTMSPITVTSMEVMTTEILGEEVTVTVHKNDTFMCYQHFVKLNATVEIDGVNLLNVTTTEYCMSELEKSPLSSSIEPTSIPTEWKYLWDNIWFVKSPGPPDIWVKYDRPNNDAPDGEYHPGEINAQYELYGRDKIHAHIPQHILEEAKLAGTFTAIIGALIGIAAAALAFPELIISKLVVAIVGVIAAILAVIGILAIFFIDDIIRSDLDDGWSWLWGFGSALGFKWWWQSFGRWRDWGWLFVALDTGDVSGGSVGYGGGGGIHWRK